MKRKIAILGYETINIGDDIQSFITSTLVTPDYIINRDDYDEIYDYKTKKRVYNLEEEVILIMNGWFMHSGDKTLRWHNIKFPIKNKMIKPFFISTCLARETEELLQPEKINFYKENQPFFCRDHFTKKNLDLFGVENEYFGCLTQLLDVDKVEDNKEYEEKFSNSTIYVDCEPLKPNKDKEEKVFVFNHYINQIRGKNPVDRIAFAKTILQRYKYAKKIYTTRLHCFLPCRAMGLDVEYVGVVNWRTKDLVNNLPDVDKMKTIFYENLEKKLVYEK